MPLRTKQHSQGTARFSCELQTPQPATDWHLVPFEPQEPTAAHTPELNACSAAQRASVALGGRINQQKRVSSIPSCAKAGA